LRHRNFLLFDAQMMNSHLERFGACTVNEQEYILLLQQAIAQTCSFDELI
ncbi:MAG: leucyl/phenylalanyl-tRNA--protein transferase, partial [Moorea sp. SIO2C4]|nr:leucyl/phenylalanyl-tRNA--protein transferase [Moorena sp. SIO2C4]